MRMYPPTRRHATAIPFEPLERRTLLSSGGLDTAFGVNGISESLAQENGRLTATAIMVDGRLIVTETTGTNTFVVHRVHTDGSADGSFGSSGRTASQLRQPADVFGVALQSDHKAVVGGSVGSEAFLLRYLTNGKHDKAFGSGGLVTVNFPGATSSIIRDVGTLSNGQIVVAGEAVQANGSSAVALARFNANGSLDSTFGTDSGFTLTKFAFPFVGNHTFSVNRLAVAPNGALLTAGRFATGPSVSDPAGDALAVARFESNGNPDGRFGSGGLALRDFGTLNESATGITVDDEARPIVSVSGANLLGAFRLTTRGRGDTTFGTNGLIRAATDIGNANDILLDNEQRIVLGGELGAGEGVVARFNADGSIDSDFGNLGISEPIPFTGEGAVQRVALAPDTTILASGTSGSAPSNQIATARIFPEDGPLGAPITRPLTTLTFDSYVFRVEWRASEGIDTSTLDNGDILVTGPNNYSRPARFISFDASLGEDRVVARYKVAPPAGIGIWNSVANGTYTIHVRENQVADLRGTFAPAGPIGTFRVTIG